MVLPESVIHSYESSDSVAGRLPRDSQDVSKQHLLLEYRDVKFRYCIYLNKQNYTLLSDMAKTLKVAQIMMEGNRPQVNTQAHSFRTLASTAGQRPTPAKWLHLSC